MVSVLRIFTLPRCRPLAAKPLRFLFLLAVALCLARAAEASTVTVTWDASPDPSVRGYRVYVGTSPGVYSETFDVVGVTSFVYANAVDGTQYYFAVASFDANHLVGPPSTEISGVSVPVNLSSSAVFDITVRRADNRTSSAQVTCVRENAQCYSVQVLAEGRGAISGLAPTPDGRLLFIEDGQRIRVLGPAQLSETALVVDSATTTLVALALDPAFDATGYVYVGEIEAGGRDGRTRQAIARYRLLNNVLGERLQVTTVATGTTGSVAPFTVGSDGRLYVAVSATSEYAVSENGVAAGGILRLMPDGTVPTDNWRSSPLFATSVASPDAVAFDLRGQRLWVGAAGPVPVLASVDLAPAPVANALRRASRASLRTSATDSGSVQVAAAAGASESTTLLVTGPGQVVYASTITPDQTAPVLRIVPLDASGPITAVAMDQSGRGYLVTQSVGRDGTLASSIVALIPAN